MPFLTNICKSLNRVLPDLPPVLSTQPAYGSAPGVAAQRALPDPGHDRNRIRNSGRNGGEEEKVLKKSHVYRNVMLR